jgi:hypothetical protein
MRRYVIVISVFPTALGAKWCVECLTGKSWPSVRPCLWDKNVKVQIVVWRLVYRLGLQSFWRYRTRAMGMQIFVKLHPSVGCFPLLFSDTNTLKCYNIWQPLSRAFSLLQCYASYCGNWLLTFRDTLVPYSKVKQSSWKILCLKMGLIGYSKMSVTNYQSTQRNIPEGRRYTLHCGGSVKCRRSRRYYRCAVWKHFTDVAFVLCFQNLELFDAHTR